MKVHVTENSAVMFWGLSDEDDKKYFERNAGKISWNERMLIIMNNIRSDIDGTFGADSGYHPGLGRDPSINTAIMESHFMYDADGNITQGILFVRLNGEAFDKSKAAILEKICRRGMKHYDTVN